MCCTVELSLEFTLLVLPLEDTGPETTKGLFRCLRWVVCALGPIVILVVPYVQEYLDLWLSYTPTRKHLDNAGQYRMARKKSTNSGGYTGGRKPTPPPEPPERITGLECYEYSKLTERAGRA